MARETLEAPSRVAALLGADRAEIAALTRRLRAQPPPFAITVARGSSDHAAGYGRYLLESMLGLVTASAAPSVVTHYKAKLDCAGALAIAVSQSGASPDLCATLEALKAGGAYALSLVNVPDSPLARLADVVQPLHAGAETSVAATKSFICALAALARLVAEWREDRSLLAALDALPDRLAAAARADWSAALPILTDAQAMVVVARGRAFPIAQEIALKFKETCQVQAEPFSAAEFMHGPVALIEPRYPVLVLAIEDETLAGVCAATEALAAKGAHMIVASTSIQARALAHTALSLPAPLHPALDPILAVQAFYGLADRLAQARGLDADRPRHLRKVTLTV
ncbi:MAG: SIS domain-containing protein [Alphaproteobacteria bacterium]|nr:SIS domain-containing protein [Alphaproteobacteria bacterium]